MCSSNGADDIPPTFDTSIKSLYRERTSRKETEKEESVTKPKDQRKKKVLNKSSSIVYQKANAEQDKHTNVKRTR